MLLRLRLKVLCLRMESLGEKLVVRSAAHRFLIRILLVLALRAICEIEILIWIRQGCDGP